MGVGCVWGVCGGVGVWGWKEGGDGGWGGGGGRIRGEGNTGHHPSAQCHAPQAVAQSAALTKGGNLFCRSSKFHCCPPDPTHRQARRT